MNSDKITRIEVIENDKRVYSKWNCKIETDVQDKGRTLKVFVEQKETEAHRTENRK